jgi:DNA-binding response OmpR family regulator
MIKILVLSAKSYPVDRDTAISLGADDYMVKPFDVSDMIEKVETLIGRPDTPDR